MDRPRKDQAPPASSPAVRRTMQANRGFDTRAEVALRSALHRRGLRFRKNLRLAGLRTQPDVVFPRARVVVYVDGCFWHGCPQHYRPARTNARYWSEKIERNIARDRATEARLASAGWLVVRVWEHEDPAVAAERVIQAVRSAA